MSDHIWPTPSSDSPQPKQAPAPPTQPPAPAAQPPAPAPQSSVPAQPITINPDAAAVATATGSTQLEQVLYEVKKVIVGQDLLLEQLIVALLARGHVLVEGVPGLAKTLAVKTLASAIGGEYQRIQFTPDLVPADLTGTRIYNQKTGEFETTPGPVFTNLLLADEINRAPAKVQSALLEVMQERQVTIGRDAHQVPDPFLVMATQNPIESEGTYPLPEAQLDRFMLKVHVGYPSQTEEFVIVERMTTAFEKVNEVIDPDTLRTLQAQVDRVYVDPALIDYSVRVVHATRDPALANMPGVNEYITHGASPRGSINMIQTAKALAFVRGRDYVLPPDVTDLALEVLRHRLVLSYRALSERITADDILHEILAHVPIPDVALSERPRETSILSTPRHGPRSPRLGDPSPPRRLDCWRSPRPPAR